MLSAWRDASAVWFRALIAPLITTLLKQADIVLLNQVDIQSEGRIVGLEGKERKGCV